MSDAVMVALISTLGAAYAVTLPILISTRKHAKAASTQTQNSHTENLRDDVDLLIVAVHQLNSALDVENTLVRERAYRIRQRREQL